MALIWADECTGCDGAPPDPQLWGWRPMDAWHPPYELQTYTDDPANAAYDGKGHLVVRARRERGPVRRYTSARLSADRAGRPALLRYGYFAARLRVPDGRGVWPAWWLLGEDGRYGWPECGEIDVMEAPSSSGTLGQVHQGTHSPAARGDGSVGVGVVPSMGTWSSGFHTYAADWVPSRVTFYLDDRPTGAVSRRDVESNGGIWVFDDRMLSPVLNVAVGGWAGLPDDSWTEQEMLVDWVRIYDHR